jgi:hypothetical protein
LATTTTVLLFASYLQEVAMHFHQHPAVAAQLVHNRVRRGRAIQRPPAPRFGAARAARWQFVSGLVIVLALTGLTIVATAQAAPSVVADRSCYSLLTPVTLAGDGFTPDGDLLVAATVTYPDGATADAGTVPAVADAQGHVEGAFGLPQIDYRRLTFTATVSDLSRIAQGAPVAEQSASTTFSVAPFGAYFRPWNTDGPARARPGRRARLEVDGYIATASRTLYVHYVRRGRLVKTQRVGRLDPECGSLTTRFEQFAFRPVEPGTYRVFFDTTRRWPNEDAWTEYRRVVVSRARGRAQQAPRTRDLQNSGRSPRPLGNQLVRLARRPW